MILLLGGTSETAMIAEALAADGYEIVVSTATEIPLDVGRHPRISHRKGRLNESDMTVLVKEKKIKAVVDAAHPYASHVHSMARRVAQASGVYYAAYVRPSILPGDDCVQLASTHEEAASACFRNGCPVLLTIGSKNLQPYAREALRTGTTLFARVLPHVDSIALCRQAGIPDARIIVGRGPFSIEENREHIRANHIGVLVTKDSGKAGGVPEKLEAANAEGCRVIMVVRPQQPSANAFEDIQALMRGLAMHIPGKQ